MALSFISLLHYSRQVSERKSVSKTRNKTALRNVWDLNARRPRGRLEFLRAGAAFPAVLESKWPRETRGDTQASTVNARRASSAAGWRLQPDVPGNRAKAVVNASVLLSQGYKRCLKSQGMSRAAFSSHPAGMENIRNHSRRCQALGGPDAELCFLHTI